MATNFRNEPDLPEEPKEKTDPLEVPSEPETRTPKAKAKPRVRDTMAKGTGENIPPGGTQGHSVRSAAGLKNARG